MTRQSALRRPSTENAGRSQGKHVPPLEILSFLKDSASYPEPPESIRIVQTHASYVAICPEYVYKIKKPINLGFLDFSTLAKRLFYCEEEVRLNRRLCSKIYVGVVPISRNSGRLEFSDEGPIVEYAVKMRRLSEGRFLNQMVSANTVLKSDLNRVAMTLARFYSGQKSTPEAASWGRVEKLKVSTDENFEQTERFVGELISRPAFEAVRYFTGLFYDLYAHLLNRRRAGGHILDCHGDLHLDHIHITEEDVCIYDCIEFNERFRYIDSASDVAFLAMDLDFNDQQDLARYFCRQLSSLLNDPDQHVLINFYKCYRAFVRAKVESMTSSESEIPSDERKASRARARRYYELALRYTIAASEPHVIVIMGRVGTGKSALARSLADALGWELLSSDRIRKTQAGVALYKRGSADERHSLYARNRTDATYSALADRAIEQVRTNRGIILDATYGRLRHRDALRASLASANISCLFVELKASQSVIEDRLKQRESERQVISDARLEDLDMLNTHYEIPDALEDPLHVMVESETKPEQTVLETLKHIIRIGLTKNVNIQIAST